MSAYEGTILEDTLDYINKSVQYAAEPFIRDKYKSEYFGGKEGLDIADPLDIALSAGQSSFRLLDKLIRVPFVKGTMKIGDELSGLVGDDITSQEEFDAFRSIYDPEGSTDIFKSTYYGDPEQTWRGAGNYFRYPVDSKDSQVAAMLGLPEEGQIAITPHAKGKGVNPITAAEEIEHARRYATGAFGAGLAFSPSMESLGDIGDYFARVIDEGLTKGTALANVAKNEGILEALTSIYLVVILYI